MRAEPEHLATARVGRICTAGWIAVVVPGLAIGAAAVLVAQKLLRLHPAYPSFVVGAITWEAESKLQDLASYPVFLIAALGAGFLRSRLNPPCNFRRPGKHANQIPIFYRSSTLNEGPRRKTSCTVFSANPTRNLANR